MATVRNYPGGAAAPFAQANSVINTSSTGVKLTYTTPAGRQSQVTLIALSAVPAGVTVRVETTIAGTTRTLQDFTAATLIVISLQLDSGDSVAVNVTVAAAGTMGALLNGLEFAAT
jgi:hypothetical protein